MVTVRIPTSASATRALTVDQAKVGIDFYEVVFKNTSDEIITASATKDKVLSITLPVGTYDSVLLAGVQSTGVLLASAYQVVTISAATSNIDYTLKALTVNVTDDVKINGLAPTAGGSPYFALPQNAYSLGSIQINNFPAVDIFDEDLLGDTNQGEELVAAVSALGEVLQLPSLYSSYLVLLVNAENAADDAADLATTWTSTNDSDAYIEAAEIAKEAYENLGKVIDGIIAGETAIATIKDYTGSTSFDSITPSDAWETLQEKVGDTVTAYEAVISEADGKDNTTAVSSELTAVSTAVGEVTSAKIASPTLDTQDLTTAISGTISDFEDITPANPFLTLSTLIVDTGAGGDAIILDPLLGYINPATGKIAFLLKTPAQNGSTKLYYNIPFKAFGADNVKRWSIKEGLDSYFIDNGTGSGGSILLQIGASPTPFIIRDPALTNYPQ